MPGSRAPARSAPVTGETTTGRIRIERGVRNTEARLTAEVERELEAQRREPSLLAHPVRIVVPSRSLREHLAAAFVRRFGTLLGFELQSLYGLAREILDRDHAEVAGGDLLYPAIVSELARNEPALQRELAPLRNGFSVVVAAVSDLIDAGLEPADGETLSAQLRGVRPSRERAEAVLRVAVGSLRRMENLGIGRASHVIRSARRALERDPERLLPSRRILVYGFADATGIASELIECLVRKRNTELLIDEPPDPADPSLSDPGAEFTQRFVARLAQSASIERSEAEVPTTELALFGAPGIQAELREVAVRVGTLLEAGERAEGIGVVARTLEPYAVAIRTQFDRAGIPFSGVGASGPPGPERRAIEALLEVVRRRADAPADRWLEARQLELSRGERADLRLALQALGAARLRDVAALRLTELLGTSAKFALPVRHGISLSEDLDRDETRPRAERRCVSRELLEQATAAAADLVGACEAWPAETNFGTHLSRLRDLLRGPLEWLPGTPSADAVFGALATLELDAPEQLRMPYSEFALLLERLLADVAAIPIGGRGGGIAVLDVTEARGRCFEHLFVVGMNRNLFPRLVTEDPLLPDSVREDWRAGLPAIPIKGLGTREERYLFAQLLHASPQVTLSWQTLDAEGRSRAPSPWIEGLRLANLAIAEDAVSSPFAPASGSAAARAPRSAHEHAILAGLYGTRGRFEAALTEALAERDRTLGYPEAEAARAAKARTAVLDEIDPGRRHPAEQLGPFFGAVGPVSHPADPRNAELFVTTLESLAACPWRTFVQRFLRIAPSPDPLSNLPGFSPMLIGAVVHEALDRLTRGSLEEARAGGGQSRFEVLMRGSPQAVAWPTESALHEIITDAALAVMRDEGIAFAGFAPALAALALPLVQRAGALDWPAAPDGLLVLGSEVQGTAPIRDAAGRVRQLHFKADRVDRRNGTPVLTDYKTGAPVSDRKTESVRRKHLLNQIGSGQRLQTVAYARSAGTPGAEGRYLFLKETLDSEMAQVSVSAGDDEANARFDSAIATLLAALDRGAFLPRLSEPKGNRAQKRCESCEVSEACVRNDSSARTRFERWAALQQNATSSTEPERLLRDLWQLPVAGQT